MDFDGKWWKLMVGVVCGLGPTESFDWRTTFCHGGPGVLIAHADGGNADLSHGHKPDTLSLRPSTLNSMPEALGLEP
eukprot:9472773-Pyramimonas_sp.AAC.1